MNAHRVFLFLLLLSSLRHVIIFLNLARKKKEKGNGNIDKTFEMIQNKGGFRGRRGFSFSVLKILAFVYQQQSSYLRASPPPHLSHPPPPIFVFFFFLCPVKRINFFFFFIYLRSRFKL